MKIPRLLENIISLYFVHIVRLVLPLVLLPLLTRRVSEETFGLYILTLSLALWLSIFVEYGFNLSATREIAKANSTDECVRIVAAVQSAKLLLVIATVPLLFGVHYFVSSIRDHTLWLATAWIVGILISLQPLFYFQGIERTKPLALIEILSGIVLLMMVWGLVSSDADAYWIAIALLISRLIALLLSQSLMLSKLSSSVFQFSFKAGRTALSDGKHIFALQALSALYTSFNIVLMGVWVGAVQIGIYGAAEKLIRAALGFVGQASSAVFPRMNRLKSDHHPKFEAYRFFCLAAFTVIGFVGVACTYLLSDIIVPFIFDNKFNAAIEVLNVLAWVIPAIAISNVLGFQYLLVEKHEKTLSVFVASGGVLNILLAFYLVPRYGYMGMAYSWVAVEWFISIGLSIAVFLYNPIFEMIKAKRITR